MLIAQRELLRVGVFRCPWHHGLFVSEDRARLRVLKLRVHVSILILATHQELLWVDHLRRLAGPDDMLMLLLEIVLKADEC